MQEYACLVQALLQLVVTMQPEVTDCTSLYALIHWPVAFRRLLTSRCSLKMQVSSRSSKRCTSS